MIELRAGYWAVEVPGDAGPATILSAFQPNTLSYEYSVEKAERCETGLIAMIDLPPGTWEIVCTSKDAKATHAPKLFGYAMIGDDYAKESLNSLLTAKGCDVNKNYLILKKA